MYQNMQVHTKTFIAVPVQQVHTSTYQYILVHISIYQYTPVHTSAYQYIPVHTSSDESDQGSKKVQMGFEPVTFCIQ
jgi:hypothetical protein